MPTLTSAEILMDVMEAFKKRLPALNRMGTDFRAQSLKLNNSYTAYIARHMMDRRKDWHGMFEVRELRAVA